MSVSRFTIQFNEDFANTDTIEFELYNTSTLVTTTYLYTCVASSRQINEFVESPTFDNPGEGTCGSYRDAILTDYGVTNWSIERTTLNTLQFTAISEDTVFQNGATALNVDFTYETIPKPEPPTRTSYFYEFTDVKGIEHRVEIEYASNPIEWVEIKGSYEIEVANNEDVLTPLRPKQATLNLEADINLSFSDLYSEEERVYKVTIIRDAKNILVGWLSSDGLYENFVSDKWIISLGVIDGLGYLTDLGYLDEIGAFYSGKQTDVEKLVNALSKTELYLGIRTSINIYYDGLNGVDVLSNTYFNSERYVTENNNEPLSCEDVLVSVLDKYNAVITQEEGFWYIYRPNEIYESANLTFYNYDSQGVLVSGENKVIKDITFNLGSQADGFYPHHVNSNQQKSLQRSLGVYRLNFKYGKVFPYYENVNLLWDNLTTIPEWTINTASGGENFIFPCDNLQGFKVFNASSPIVVAFTDDYIVDESPQMEFNVTFSNTNDFDFGLGLGGATFNCKIIYVKGSNTYHLTREGKWVTTAPLIQFAIEVGEKNFNLRVISEQVPESDGTLRIDLYDSGFGSATFPICIHKMVIQTYNGEEVSQGKNYTIEKVSNFTPNSDKTENVLNGDVPDNTYYSAIYENDQITNTEFWYRKNYTESKPLLRIMVEDRMRMNFKPKVLFEGDVFGYLPFLSRVNVANVKDKMMAIEWGYDASNNITRVKLLEILNENFDSLDVIYSVTEDYGDSVKPVIIS